VVALPRDVVPRGRDISKLLDLAHHVLHRRSERILLMTPGTFRTLLGLAFAAAMFAQEPQPSQGGWPRFGESQDPAPPDPLQSAASVAPSQLMLPAGTFITVRPNDTLSSDHNQPGDAFTATLSQPLIARGYVIALRGQTIGGRIVDAQKAGRVKGTSRLGLELTDLSLVDGQQMPVRTELIQYTGGTSAGRDATAVAATTGIGAAVGAAANGGFGSGVGALAGAAASTIGVLVTRGRTTVVYPEATLTFRTTGPITISTDGAQQAFRIVRQEDYEPIPLRRAVVRLAQPPPYYYGYGRPWPHYYDPYSYGPNLFIYSHPGIGFGHSFHGGFHGH